MSSPPPTSPYAVPVLRPIVHRIDPLLGLTGLCAGFDRRAWRADALAQYLTDQLPGFCLSHGELAGLSADTMTQLVREAANLVYTSKKFAKRGEFGELLLHVVLRQVFATVPAISKIYYKDSANDTVKGFDAVHVVVTATGLELWLGEVKFYSDVRRAITDVVKELGQHTERQYLRREFAAIQRKVDRSWPHADRLLRLLHEHTPLDEVFDAACVPVLLTYDSATLGGHEAHTDACLAALEAEMEAHHATFRGCALPKDVRIHLFLVPLRTKKLLLQALDRKLRVWQQI